MPTTTYAYDAVEIGWSTTVDDSDSTYRIATGYSQVTGQEIFRILAPPNATIELNYGLGGGSPILTYTVDGGASQDATYTPVGDVGWSTILTTANDASNHLIVFKYAAGSAYYRKATMVRVTTPSGSSALLTPTGYGPINWLYNGGLQTWWRAEGGALPNVAGEFRSDWMYATHGALNPTTGDASIRLSARGSTIKLLVRCSATQHFTLVTDGTSESNLVPTTATGAFHWVTVTSGADDTAYHDYDIRNPEPLADFVVAAVMVSGGAAPGIAATPPAVRTVVGVGLDSISKPGTSHLADARLMHARQICLTKGYGFFFRGIDGRRVRADGVSGASSPADGQALENTTAYLTYPNPSHILIVGFANDFWTKPATLAQVKTAILSSINQMLAANSGALTKLVWWNVLPINDVDVMVGYSSWEQGLIDEAAASDDPSRVFVRSMDIFGSPPDYATYYGVDTVHPNDAGNTLMATMGAGDFDPPTPSGGSGGTGAFMLAGAFDFGFDD